MTDCQICGSRAALNLCRECVRILQEELDRIPDLIEELDARIAKPVQNRYRVRLNEGDAESNSAPPLDLEMSSARRNLHGSDVRGSTVARLPDARGAASRLLATIASVSALLDEKPELRVWGQCPTEGCPATIKAPMSHRRTRCPECGWLLELSTVMSRRMAQLDHHPTPPRQTREILLELTGIRVTKKTFENWVYHRRLGYVLDRVGTDGTGRRLYRVRDLLFVYQSRP